MNEPTLGTSHAPLPWLRRQRPAPVTAAALGFFLFAAGCSRTPSPPCPPQQATAEATTNAQPGEEATPAQVKTVCGGCHATPPPDTFPKNEWRAQVTRGFKFLADSPLRRKLRDAPSPDSVVHYFERRAPDTLADAPPSAATPSPLRFTRQSFREPGVAPLPATSSVELVALNGAKKRDLLLCDMRFGRVMTLMLPASAGLPAAPAWRTLATLKNPACATVADLDGDGIRDVLVADLGHFLPTDEPTGRVVWLRGKKNGVYTPVTLLDNVGRVADVEAGDFNGDGKMDLLVADFGMDKSGAIIALENRTRDPNHPVFAPHVLDRRHGAIATLPCDLNGDGRLDFVALLAQEHETVLAFLNRGRGRFEPKTIYAAPHPAFGSSSIELADINGDSRLDVLYTNGDVFDPPPLLRPDNGVQWLENKGTFPFTRHGLAHLYGASRATAADLDGDGDLDITAVGFLPQGLFPARKTLKPPSVLLVEQTAPGVFARHVLETETGDHATCATGDVNGDGRPDLIVGNFIINRPVTVQDALTVWLNQGRFALPVRTATAAPR